MRLILVTGFLGTGKTTTILDLARYLTGVRRQQLAILVNEAGEIPLDGAVLTAAGNRVKEIFAGCICCQLVGDLAEAVNDFTRVEGLDYLVIEPSGIADPEQLARTLSRLAQPIWRHLCLIDAVRYELLNRAAGRLIEAGLATADVVLVNKVDAVSPEAQAAVLEAVRQRTSAQAIYPVSVQQGLAETLWAALLDDGI